MTGQNLGVNLGCNKLLLAIDTYDNDTNGNNPVISLRGSNCVLYIESTQRWHNKTVLGHVLPNSSFVADGQWHKVKLVYNAGHISVSFDDAAAAIFADFIFNSEGYFGFSAGTGIHYSRQSMRNVQLEYTPAPPPVLYRNN